MLALGLYCLVQCLMPLRHWLYPGNVAWTEEGHRFSWRMKLRTKEADTQFYGLYPDTESIWIINPHDYLAPHQVDEMETRPDMILQFCHYIAELMAEDGVQGFEIRVDAQVSLNSRPPQALIDPSVNLVKVPRTWQSSNWILALARI